jgi:hypothetical protein
LVLGIAYSFVYLFFAPRPVGWSHRLARNFRTTGGSGNPFSDIVASPLRTPIDPALARVIFVHRNIEIAGRFVIISPV